MFWLHDIVHCFYAVSTVVYLKYFLDDDFMTAVIFDSTVFYTITVKCNALVRLNCEQFIYYFCLFVLLFVWSSLLVFYFRITVYCYCLLYIYIYIWYMLSQQWFIWLIIIKILSSCFSRTAYRQTSYSCKCSGKLLTETIDGFLWYVYIGYLPMGNWITLDPLRYWSKYHQDELWSCACPRSYCYL